MTDQQREDYVHACFIFARRVLNLDDNGQNDFIEFVAKQIRNEKDEAIKKDWLDMIHIFINTWCLDDKTLTKD